MTFKSLIIVAAMLVATLPAMAAELEEFYYEGFEAGKKGMPSMDNPYRRLCFEQAIVHEWADQWDAGWRDGEEWNRHRRRRKANEG
jgi:hypothetical protein